MQIKPSRRNETDINRKIEKSSILIDIEWFNPLFELFGVNCAIMFKNTVFIGCYSEIKSDSLLKNSIIR